MLYPQILSFQCFLQFSHSLDFINAAAQLHFLKPNANMCPTKIYLPIWTSQLVKSQKIHKGKQTSRFQAFHSIFFFVDSVACFYCGEIERNKVDTATGK